MPTLTALDLSAFKADQTNDPKLHYFSRSYLDDLSDRTLTWGYEINNPTEWMHVYLEDGNFMTVRYIEDFDKCVFRGGRLNTDANPFDLIPEVLIMKASDREFCYKFMEKCGNNAFREFDLTPVNNLLPRESYRGPTSEELWTIS